MEHDVKSELVRSTAFLRREFLGRDKFKKKKNTIYIFDTNVIVTSCAPWIAGPAEDQGGSGYGEPISFFDPESKKINIDLSKRKQKSERVAKILATHALNLSGSLPIYQFRPHFDKTAEIYGYVRNDAERMGRKTDKIAQQDRNRRSIIQLSALIASRTSGKDDHNISHDTMLLTQLLNNSVYSLKSEEHRKIQEWDNFVELNTKHGGVFSIGHASQHFLKKAEASLDNNDQFEQVAAAVDGFSLDTLSGQERVAFENLKKHWRRSSVWSNREKKEESYDNYSTSLALLGLLNKRLIGLGWRAVFVTGSINVVDAAYDSIPEREKAILGDVADNFGNRFVRHIWAYTSEALIEPNNNAKFVNWLDGLLGRWAGKSSFKTLGLSNLRKQKHFPGVTVSDCRDAFESWDAQTSTMVAQHNFFSVGKQTKDLKQKLIARIQQSLQEKLDWTTISNHLLEENDRANDEAFLIFSNIGVDALISAQKTSRHPPDLDFESLTNTKKIFITLTSNEGYISRQQFEEDFKAIENECYAPSKDNRQFSHLRYLALGAAFASASRWSVALSQAQRAIRIIERSKERHFWPIPKKNGTNSFMSGREAYFLAAVSLRMISITVHDFVGSARYLGKAYEALNADKEADTAHNFDELRFLNEECAHALSLYYFARMNDEANFQDQRYESVVARLESLLNPIDFLRKSAKLKNHRASTLAHVALNTIQVHTIKAFRDSKELNSPDSRALKKETLQDALSVLRTFAGDKENQKSRLFRTKLMTCYDLLGSILVYGAQKNAKEDIENAFRGWEKTAVTQYDRWRYINLRILANELANVR